MRELVAGALLYAGEQRNEALTNALLRSGELECALADAEHPAQRQASSLTDALAASLLSGTDPTPAVLKDLLVTRLPDKLIIRRPEGFAYYGLSPARYAELVAGLGTGSGAAVIGIRSIGTVLSAICSAKLGCERITVRPTGHPYDRELHLSATQRSWIQAQMRCDREFFVVDEGPGMSGSSFLSVGEALSREGVHPSSITLLGSNACDPTRLVTRDSQRRWNRYRSMFAGGTDGPPESRPFKDWDWRAELLPRNAAWPAVWRQLAPPKYLAANGKVVWKFEGLGSAGDLVRSRGQLLAKSGFSPAIVAVVNGFTGYEFIQGRALAACDWNSNIERKLLDYLVFRAVSFAQRPDRNPQLLHMIRHNLLALTGAELGADFQLKVESPAICDGRMMPHEWLSTADGRLLKVDGVMHGDDHFFPGPTDIAWDLAGAIIEWQLDREAEERLVASYERRTGDQISSRLASFRLAYAVFRAAYSKMAATAVTDPGEATRFHRELDDYRRVLVRLVTPFAGAQRNSQSA